MSWTTPSTQTVGHIVTSTEYNGHIINNLLERRTSVIGANGGTVVVGGTYTITAPETGNYILEYGAGGIDTVSTGTTLTLQADTGGAYVRYSDTGGGAGIAFSAGVPMSAGQVVTITCALTSGSASASLQNCFAKLTRTP